MPSLPNFHLPKQNWADRNKPNQSQRYLVSNHHGHPVVIISISKKLCRHHLIVPDGQSKTEQQKQFHYHVGGLTLRPPCYGCLVLTDPVSVTRNLNLISKVNANCRLCMDPCCGASFIFVCTVHVLPITNSAIAIKMPFQSQGCESTGF